MPINYNTVVVAETTSRLDGQPIVVLASGFLGCNNRKLGSNVIQTFYFHREIHPTEAIASSADFSVCGDCKLRPSNSDACYVGSYTLSNMWLSYKNNRCRNLSDHHLAQIKQEQKVLRLGAYGDPTIVPISVVRPLIKAATAVVGYTHQWQASEIAAEYQSFLQASVDTSEEAAQARALGWHTFRIKQTTDSVEPGEVICPHSIDRNIQCQVCRLCNGKSKNVAIDIHGSQGANARKLAAYLAN